MAWFIPAIAVGALIELKCPHCSKMQLQARKAKGTEVLCRFCHTGFDRAEGEKHKGSPGR